MFRVGRSCERHNISARAVVLRGDYINLCSGLGTGYHAIATLRHLQSLPIAVRTAGRHAGRHRHAAGMVTFVYNERRTVTSPHHERVIPLAHRRRGRLT